MFSLSRITKENEEYFEDLLPEEGLKRNEQALGVLTEDEDAVAALVFAREDNIISLEWLYVDPDYRRQGVGLHLLGAAIELMENKGELMRAAYYEDMEGMPELLDKLGFYSLDGNATYQISIDAIRDSSEIVKLQKMHLKKQPIPLDVLLREERDRLLQYLSESCDARLFLQNCDPKTSFCMQEEDKSVSGCLLTKKLEENRFQVQLMLNTGGVMQSLVLLKTFLEQCIGDEMKGAELLFVAANPHVISLVERLTKDAGEEGVSKKQLRIAIREIAA